MIIVAGNYQFLDIKVLRTVLASLGLDSSDVRIRGINTARFTAQAAHRRDDPNTIAEDGALHKAEPYRNMMGPKVPVFGIMLVAVLGDGTVLSNANVWKPPPMTGKSVRFHLGVTLSWERQTFRISKNSKRYRIFRPQAEIDSAVRRIMLEGPVIMPVNPYTTHPESYLSEYDAQKLRGRLSKALLTCIKELLSDAQGTEAAVGKIVDW